MKITEEKFTPKCPHCNALLHEIIKTTKGWIDQHTVYACPVCMSVLSTGMDRWS